MKSGNLIFLEPSAPLQACNRTALLVLLTAIELSLGGSSLYTSTDKTNKNKFTWTEQYKKHSINNTKHSKYKYTYYQNTHTYTHTHTLQNKLKEPHYKIHPIEIVTV